MEVIYKLYWDFPFSSCVLPKGSKMIGHRRISSIYVFKHTDKNVALANRHNEIIKQIEALNAELSSIVNEQMEAKINKEQ